jgi:energy-coupling factor transport system ATP-binding protein
MGVDLMRKIILENVSSQYRKSKKPQLDNINLTINEGELTLLAGPSGSGKSTLVLLLNGIIPHHTRARVSGNISVFGLNPSETSVLKMSKFIGMLLQDPDSQLATSRVKDEIILTLEFQGKSREEIDSILQETLNKFGIDHLSNLDSTKMSGGEKQLVALAAMMSLDPDIIILDEPTSNLDPVNTAQILNHIQEFKEAGKTIILIEHKIDEVFHYCIPDRIILMNNGQILAHEDPDSLMREKNLIESVGLAVPEVSKYIKESGIFNDQDTLPTTISSFKKYATTLQPTEINNLKTILQSTNRVDCKTDEMLLEFINVDFRYRNQQKSALDSIKFTLKRGEFIAIVGNNGAGKSTLLKHAIGLNKPLSGEVIIDQIKTSKTTAAKLAPIVSFLFQNPDNQLFASSVLKEVIYAPLNCGMSKEEALDRANTAINSVNLGEFTSTNPLKLSMGQKQRVAVASSLAMKPKIIILDEPTTGQDPTSLKGIMDLMLQEYQNGATIVMVTHDMNLVDRMANRTIVIHEGRQLLDDTTDKVFMNTEVMSQANLEPPIRIQMLKVLTQ